jgi:hypothetical protein
MMKRLDTPSIVIVVSSIFFLFKLTYAADFQFQPRLETGVSLYSIDIGGIHQSVQAMPGGSTGGNLTQQKIEFRDIMNYVGGGTTLFINRLFVDLGMQYSFDGNDRTHASWSIYMEDDGSGSSFFESADPEYRGEFNRQDLAVSVGYAITDRFSIFVGYKWAELDLDTTFEGPYSLVNIDYYVGHGSITGEEHLQFKYEGPFVGVTHGWQIDWSSKYIGLFSVNIGLARLNCQLNQDQKGNIRVDSVNGIDIEPINAPYTYSNEVKGETLGLTLALGWCGITQIKHLTYSVGISGYRYQFDLDESSYQEISELSLICKVGIAYAF